MPSDVQGLLWPLCSGNTLGWALVFIWDGCWNQIQVICIQGKWLTDCIILQSIIFEKMSMVHLFSMQNKSSYFYLSLLLFVGIIFL